MNGLNVEIIVDQIPKLPERYILLKDVPLSFRVQTGSCPDACLLQPSFHPFSQRNGVLRDNYLFFQPPTYMI